MRTRFRWDKDLEAIVEIREGSNYYEEPPQGPAVISDDVGAGVKGLRHMPSGKMLDSKSRFREANRRAGVHEVGNETDFASKASPLPKDHYGQIVKDAYDQFTGNYNGIADRVTQEARNGRRQG